MRMMIVSHYSSTSVRALLVTLLMIYCAGNVPPRMPASTQYDFLHMLSLFLSPSLYRLLALIIHLKLWWHVPVVLSSSSSITSPSASIPLYSHYSCFNHIALFLNCLTPSDMFLRMMGYLGTLIRFVSYFCFNSKAVDLAGKPVY